jgi:hypothetical protein
MIESGYENFGNRPQVLGELGVPMDLKYVLRCLALDRARAC